MSGRIINLTLSLAPIQRIDRANMALVDLYGPMRDEDALQIESIDTWPNCSGLVMDGTDQGNWPTHNLCDFDDFIWWSGNHRSLYLIAGVAKDKDNNIVSNANIDLYRTLDDVLIASVMSNYLGQFAIQLDNNTVAHYIRAWRLSPAIQGTTVDNLTGQAYP